MHAKRTLFSLALTAATTSLLLPAAKAEPNAQMKQVLDTYAVLSPIPLEKTTPMVARAAPTISTAAEAVMKKEGKPAPPFTGKIENIKVETPNGNVAARVYTPSGDGPFPVVFYIHGGGWVIASIDAYDASARALCEMAKAVVVSTEYRKAPENKFPASHEDTWNTYQWTLQGIGKYGGDPKRVAVAGESAGGNMAAAICLMAKKQGVQMPVAQLLVYPVADTSMSTESYKENENTKPLSAKGMAWFFDKELGQSSDAQDTRLNLVRSNDFKGMPPTTIIAAEIDPLRSEGKALADKLKAAGVDVTYRLYPGVTHEFFGMGGVVDEAKEAEELAATQLKQAFGGKTGSSKSASD